MADNHPQYGSTVAQRWDSMHKVTLWHPNHDESATFRRAYYREDCDDKLIRIKIHDDRRKEEGLPLTLKGWECLATVRQVYQHEDDDLDDDEQFGQAEVVNSYPRGSHRIIEMPAVTARGPQLPAQLQP
ncbi:hypothetical protein OSG_eHP14_00020 [environmental Halophage eHP-14]|nr:hypothetical protein OSG_eHP14_00020 [environmental Halophage eHP-14]